MQKDHETIMLIVGVLGAWMRGLVENLVRRETIVNMVAGLFLTMLFVGTIQLLKCKVENILICIAVSFFVGWICINFTRKLRCVIEDVYDILKQWFKNLLKVK